MAAPSYRSKCSFNLMCEVRIMATTTPTSGWNRDDEVYGGTGEVMKEVIARAM